MAWSGGSEPGNEINPSAIDAMSERGPRRSSAPLTSSSPWAAATPARSSPGKRYLDWPLEEPAGQTVDDIRPIRDAIERRVRGLLNDLGVSAQH
ncbi:hypothetical protein [Streptomyces sp. NPDC096142]|uniref:hypothetical protein n=1 Tax=Streptomyces sp. NPDC096142 TaxID=3366077 RepID=UPI0037FFCFCA